MMKHKRYFYRGKIVSTWDEDTFRADIDLGFGVWKHHVLLSLHGIEAPALREPTLKEARASRAFLHDLVLGKEVYIQIHKNPNAPSERLTAELWLVNASETTHSINEEMVLVGHAIRK